MIEHEVIPIATVADYAEKLPPRLTKYFPRASIQPLVTQLAQRVGTACQVIILEYPYRDYDFSSVFSRFYAKKHLMPSRECIRLHLFADSALENYIGFCVVRDSSVDSRGKAVLDPAILLTIDKAHIITTRHKSHLSGSLLGCESIAWMAQDTDIAVCAHVAVWTIVNYYASKYPHYRQRSIGDIVDQVPQYLGRKTPSAGLNLFQISELLTVNGFFPLILKRQSVDDRSFLNAVYSYIESGIPMVAAMTRKGHAVAIVGHGEPDYNAVYESCGVKLHSDFISDLVITDDNYLPFTTISQNSGGSYSMDDLDFVIIPLYEKMYLNANIVHERVRGLIDSDVLQLPADVIVRVYLTSTRSLKREAAANISMNEVLKSILLQLEMPQFVWVADICTHDHYVAAQTSARIIIDATAGTYERDPWLMWHDSGNIAYRESTDAVSVEIEISPYPLYRNNLKEIIK